MLSQVSVTGWVSIQAESVLAVNDNEDAGRCTLIYANRKIILKGNLKYVTFTSLIT